MISIGSKLFSMIFSLLAMSLFACCCQASNGRTPVVVIPRILAPQEFGDTQVGRLVCQMLARRINLTGKLNVTDVGAAERAVFIQTGNGFGELSPRALRSIAEHFSASAVVAGRITLLCVTDTKRMEAKVLETLGGLEEWQSVAKIRLELVVYNPSAEPIARVISEGDGCMENSRFSRNDLRALILKGRNATTDFENTHVGEALLKAVASAADRIIEELFPKEQQVEETEKNKS